MTDFPHWKISGLRREEESWIASPEIDAVKRMERVFKFVSQCEAREARRAMTGLNTLPRRAAVFLLFNPKGTKNYESPSQ